MNRGPGQPPKGRIRTVLHLSPRARSWLEAEAERRQASMADVADEVLQARANEAERQLSPDK